MLSHIMYTSYSEGLETLAGAAWEEEEEEEEEEAEERLHSL